MLNQPSLSRYSWQRIYVPEQLSSLPLPTLFTATVLVDLRRRLPFLCSSFLRRSPPTIAEPKISFPAVHIAASFHHVHLLAAAAADEENPNSSLLSFEVQNSTLSVLTAAEENPNQPQKNKVVQLAYMYWVQGYKLSDAHKLVLSKRSCCPNLEAIKNATADILTGLKKKSITLQWAGKKCSSVDISGLDIGWGEKLPLNLNKEKGVWILERELPEGQYEYKYIIDGEWLCNEDEPLTTVNQDGHINNYVQVLADDPESDNAKLRLRLTGVDPDLREDERNRIKEYLEKI